MAAQSNSSQLVLFDGDEDRIRIFDDIKELYKVPSDSNFDIFCEETETIQNKILSHLSNIYDVRVRKSLDGKSILNFLNDKINNYSFILVICGLNPVYGYVFPRIWKEHGRGKLFVMILNDQYDIRIKDILVQLRCQKNPSDVSTPITNAPQAFRDYSCPKCSQSFHLDNHLGEHEKNVHGSFSEKNLYMDSSANVSSHQKSNENDKLITERQIHCRICNEDFQTKGPLKNHAEKDHPDNTQDYY
jgi:hypothetical protein